jgi:hypothetical protein
VEGHGFSHAARNDFGIGFSRWGLLANTLLMHEESQMRAYKFLDAHFGLRSLTEKRLKISTLQDLNDPFELSPYDLSNPPDRMAMRQYLREMTARYGLLCFSSDWKDPVIWAHYGDKHRGICLGFEIPADKCKTITYVPQRLAFPTSPTKEDSERILFTKYINWEYEQEVRMWARLNEKDNNLYFASFGEDLKLVKVVAGARYELSENDIVQALGPLAKNVIVIQARAGLKKFEIVENKQGFAK